ncbi:hypothetical protein E2C01_046710 [Portunus trituberculatus]|uniref:Uncharacterized protein n=1 Tax=Portunus trituberculatus TaxID=210409 RepID=A0A5B7FZA1_PORTR|nr:hypothetical protein [Portunus trituberculatus]
MEVMNQNFVRVKKLVWDIGSIERRSRPEMGWGEACRRTRGGSNDFHGHGSGGLVRSSEAQPLGTECCGCPSVWLAFLWMVELRHGRSLISPSGTLCRPTPRSATRRKVSVLLEGRKVT